MAAQNDSSTIKIFKLNRLRFDELWNDAVSYIKTTYKAVGQAFTPAAPFGQLLQVILHLGRMIFYYIEDSITGLNIRTAYRPDQIRGLAALTGHVACRPISARGAITIKYAPNTADSDIAGQICYIPNKVQLKSKINGSTYTVLFGADNAKITMQSMNYIDAVIVNGEIKIQKATGTGEPFQSYNFSERNYTQPDDFFVNVYVNNEAWPQVASLIDLGYQQKGCIVRTGVTGGIDVFFGNNAMGLCPPEGSIIMVEYLVSDGNSANISADYENTDDFWEFDGEGYLQDGTPVNLNNNFQVRLKTDVIFGTAAEDVNLTQLIAPHMSRSFVLATETNYKYFFRRMNMFSDISVIQGTSNRTGLTVLNLAHSQAEMAYQNALEVYNELLAQPIKNQEDINSAKDYLDYCQNTFEYTQRRLQSSIYVDNTVHIMLIPDIKKRITANQNYFTCPQSLFTLTGTEKANLLTLLDQSGQRCLTVENVIEDPKIARFAINVNARIFDNYSEADVYASGLAQLSDYLINWKKRDIIPVSDIVALFETKVPGIDSVQVQFIPDVKNADVYKSESYLEDDEDKPYYGIDEDYGDIHLTRTIMDATGTIVEVNDIIPVFRGEFTAVTGDVYTDNQKYNSEVLCPFNFNKVATVKNKTLSLDTYLT